MLSRTTPWTILSQRAACRPRPTTCCWEVRQLKIGLMTKAVNCHREVLALKLEKGPRHQVTMNKIFKRWENIEICQGKSQFLKSEQIRPWQRNSPPQRPFLILTRTESLLCPGWGLNTLYESASFSSFSPHCGSLLSCHRKVTGVWDSNLGWLQNCLFT